jgi:hypothetical protein
MVRSYLNKGMMEENIKGCGKMENSMEKVNFSILKRIHGKEEFGMKEKELDGQMTT